MMTSQQPLTDPDALDAIEFGILGDVKRYSDNGKDLDVNEQDLKGRTPIMLACHYGFHDILAWLLTLNPDLAIADAQGRTAMDFALAGGEPRCLKLLEKNLQRPSDQTDK